MVRRLIAIATLALAGSTALGVTAAAAQPTGGDGTVSIRLTEVPTDQAEDPRANHYVVASALPGTSLTRTVEVRNGSSDSTAVRLYAGGASVVDGEFSFMAGEGGNDLASWTTVAPATLRLAPGEAGTATVTVAVPAGAAGGERYAVVWAELPADESGPVRTVNRVGVRMYVTVGAASATWDFQVRSLEAQRTTAGDPAVDVLVENTGTGAVDLTGELRLSDGPGGVVAGPFPLQVGTTIAPGASGTITTVLPDDLPAGPWTATVTIRSGTVERVASARLTFPSETGRSGAVSATSGEHAKSAKTGSDTSLPAVAAALLAGATAVTGLGLIVRGRVLRARALRVSRSA